MQQPLSNFALRQLAVLLIAAKICLAVKFF
jgi:hypothetical protein